MAKGKERRLGLWSKRNDDDDVYYYMCRRLKLEGETENMGTIVTTMMMMMGTMGFTLFTVTRKERERWV